MGGLLFLSVLCNMPDWIVSNTYMFALTRSEKQSQNEGNIEAFHGLGERGWLDLKPSLNTPRNWNLVTGSVLLSSDTTRLLSPVICLMLDESRRSTETLSSS